MVGVFESFKKGFDCVRLPNFWQVFIVIAIAIAAGMILSAIIPLIPQILVGFFSTFYICDKVLNHLGVKTKNWSAINGHNIIEYVKYWIVDIVITMFNWVDKKILIAQIIAYVVAVISLVFLTVVGFSPALSSTFGSAAFMILVALAVIAVVVALILLIYNSIRFFVALPVRLSEAEGTVDAFKRSWELTRGRAFNIFCIQILYSILALILVIVAALPLILAALGISGAGVSLGAVLTLIGFGITLILFFIVSIYLTMFGSFVVTNYYLSIKKEMSKKK